MGRKTESPEDAEKKILRVNMRKFRLEAKLTQEDAAFASGISIDNIRNWELGKATPGLANISKLAPIYGHPIEDFLKQTPGKPDLSGRKTFFLKAFAYDDNARYQKARAYLDKALEEAHKMLETNPKK